MALYFIFIFFSFAADLKNVSTEKRNIENNRVFPYRSEFTTTAFLNKIDKGSIEECKSKILKTCKEQDFPSLTNFGFCIQKNYSQFFLDKKCYPLAHSLVYMNILGYFSRNTGECSTFFKKCEDSGLKLSKLKPCLMSNPNLPPLCYKLINDSYEYRTNLAKIFDQRLNNNEK
jgi:hypothetical protein